MEFEEKVFNDNSGDWLYIFRRCNLPADEITAKRKKLKGPQLTDLNTLICKTWIPLSA